MTKPAFVYTTYVHATPERLWQALTDPAFTQRYWRTSLHTDWQVGSTMTWENHGVTIEDPEQVVLEAEPVPPPVVLLAHHDAGARGGRRTRRDTRSRRWRASPLAGHVRARAAGGGDPADRDPRRVRRRQRHARVDQRRLAARALGPQDAPGDRRDAARGRPRVRVSAAPRTRAPRARGPVPADSGKNGVQRRSSFSRPSSAAQLVGQRSQRVRAEIERAQAAAARPAPAAARSARCRGGPGRAARAARRSMPGRPSSRCRACAARAAPRVRRSSPAAWRVALPWTRSSTRSRSTDPLRQRGEAVDVDAE